jgi:hypothetical protein
MGGRIPAGGIRFRSGNDDGILFLIIISRRNMDVPGATWTKRQMTGIGTVQVIFDYLSMRPHMPNLFLSDPSLEHALDRVNGKQADHMPYPKTLRCLYHQSSLQIFLIF